MVGEATLRTEKKLTSLIEKITRALREQQKNLLEDRSRRNNLRLDAIKERPNEREDCENELHTPFMESLGIEEEVVTERALRVKTDNIKKGNTLRTIVYRILNYKDQVKIVRNAKKTER